MSEKKDSEKKEPLILSNNELIEFSKDLVASVERRVRTFIKVMEAEGNDYKKVWSCALFGLFLATYRLQHQAQDPPVWMPSTLLDYLGEAAQRFAQLQLGKTELPSHDEPQAEEKPSLEEYDPDPFLSAILAGQEAAKEFLRSHDCGNPDCNISKMRQAMEAREAVRAAGLN